MGSETGRKATLVSTTWVKWVRDIFDQEQAGRRRGSFGGFPRSPLFQMQHPQFCRFAPIQETPFGTVDAAGDAKRQGWLDWKRDCSSSPQHCCSGPYPRRRRSYGEATGVVARGKAALSTQRSAPNFKASPSTGTLP